MYSNNPLLEKEHQSLNRAEAEIRILEFLSALCAVRRYWFATEGRTCLILIFGKMKNKTNPNRKFDPFPEDCRMC